MCINVINDSNNANCRFVVKHLETFCLPLHYTLSAKKSQALFSIASSNGTKRSNFWHSGLRNNCESGYDYVFHITCVMPIPGKTLQTSYISAINKTVN